jgi:hypothetical protein
LPWIAPSHQAPALILKLWKPRWFSGLALVLGTIAPDLEFIVQMDGKWYVGHTLLGQIYFTVPVVISLYLLCVDLLIPWALMYLPDGPPLYWHACAKQRRPEGVEWLGVAFSGYVGGLTHIFLDGFTHADRSGWAVALFPILRRTLFGAPVYEELQVVLSIVLAFVSFWAWRRIVERSPEARPVPRASQKAREELLRWLAVCLSAGVVLALGLRPHTSFGLAIERGAYGALTFLGLGFVLSALARRLLRIPRGVAFES